MAEAYSIASVEYRSINGFPGYRVGNDGSVWSRWKRVGCGRGNGSRMVQGDTWKRLKTWIGSAGAGRLKTCLGYGNQRGVARLVLEAFVGPCPSGMEACHFPDPDPRNCALSNLRWDTKKANARDKDLHGRTPRGERHGMSKLTDSQVLEIFELRGAIGKRKIAKQFGVSHRTVQDIHSGRTHKDITLA